MSRRGIGLLVAGLTIGLPAQPTRAQWQSRGELGLESRAFADDENASTRDRGLGVASRIELAARAGGLAARGRLFGRVDVEDEARNAVFVEEAFLAYRRGWVNVAAGFRTLTWTATEAFHPADIINSRNLDSNLENPEKLGEPLVQIGLDLPLARVEAYFLPVRIEPRLPSASSRLSFTPAGMTVSSPRWLERDGNVTGDGFAPQMAFRLSWTVADLDLALHAVQHHDRSQPSVLIDPQTGGLVPVFHPVRQLGGTLTWVTGALVAKVEGAYRWFHNAATSSLGPLHRPDHGQIAGGLEYGWVWQEGGEGSLLVEGQTVVGVDAETRSRLHVFQNDVLFGYRHAFGDIDGKEIFAAVIVDAERAEEALVSLRYRQRLSDTWRLECGGRLFFAAPSIGPPAGLEALDDSHQLHLSVFRSF